MQSSHSTYGSQQFLGISTVAFWILCVDSWAIEPYGRQQEVRTSKNKVAALKSNSEARRKATKTPSPVTLFSYLSQLCAGPSLQGLCFSCLNNCYSYSNITNISQIALHLLRGACWPYGIGAQQAALLNGFK